LGAGALQASTLRKKILRDDMYPFNIVKVGRN
jgi:hypothetical protein